MLGLVLTYLGLELIDMRFVFFSEDFD